MAIRKSDKDHLLKFQNGKCSRCGKSFKQMGVRPIVHHKNGVNDDNRISNMELVCPNCHDKIHQKLKGRGAKNSNSGKVNLSWTIGRRK